MALKLLLVLLILSQMGLASLAPGDCAFVEISTNQDDFALVLMDVLSWTEESPIFDHFKVSKSVLAKKHVSDAKKGAVLHKADFATEPAFFATPTSELGGGNTSASVPIACATTALSIGLAQGNVEKTPEFVEKYFWGIAEYNTTLDILQEFCAKCTRSARMTWWPNSRLTWNS